MQKTHHTISREVRLTAIKDDRFKLECLSVNFILPFKGEENARAYLLPSVLVRGCQKYGNMQKMNAVLEEAYDAEIGADATKLANYRIIRFAASWLKSSLTLDDSNPFDTTLSLLSEIILRPVKEQDGNLSTRFTELEKHALLDFARGEKNNKKNYAYRSCLKYLLAEDQFSHPKYGTEEEIQQENNISLTEFYHRMLNDTKIEIYYHGSSDGNTIKEKLIKIFGDFLTFDRPEFIKAPSTVPEFGDTVSISEKGDCNQTVLALGFSLPVADSERFPFLMLGEILYFSPISRLFMDVREELGLCYYCDYSGIRTKQAAIITAGIELKRKKEAKNAILSVIDDIAAGNISDEEMESALNANIDNYLAVFDSPKDIESMVLLSELTGEDYSVDAYINNISKVSKEQISNLAKRATLQVEFILEGN